MSNPILIRKVIEELVGELKSSNHYPSDADWYIGFPTDQNTANESEYDPKTGKVIHNTSVGDRTTYLQQWDAEPEGYVEERDSGTYSFRINNLMRAYAKKSD